MKQMKCWTCKNRYNGCTWSREFKLVTGCKWVIDKHPRASYADILILECPEYIKDERKKISKKEEALLYYERLAINEK